MRGRSLARFGIAGALAASMVVTTIGYQQVGAAGSYAPSAFVPIAPCRLFDTRPATLVGARNTPMTAGETATFAVWGTNGGCTIPATATGIATNTTIVNPTADSFLTVFPSDSPKPNASNLNWTATSSPTPNQVTVGLSVTGSISLFNNGGSVNVIMDIVGYYQPETSGPKGDTGAKGDTGNTGATGARGVSAFDTIPFGQLVTGSGEFQGSAVAGAARFSVSFPALAAVDLGSSDIEFKNNLTASDADTDADCTGTYTAPTAPNNKVCIYLNIATNVTASSMFGSALDALPKSGFRVDWTNTASTSTHIAYSWAMRGPLLIFLPFPVDGSAPPVDEAPRPPESTDPGTDFPAPTAPEAPTVPDTPAIPSPTE